MLSSNRLICLLEELEDYKGKLHYLKNNIGTTKRDAHDLLTEDSEANFTQLEFYISAALEAIDSLIPNQI